MRGVLKESILSPKDSKISKIIKFQARMSSQSLPTPRNIQSCNIIKNPRLYPWYECPLCREGIANDHHIIARYSAMSQIRATSVTTLKGIANESLRRIVPGPLIPIGLLRMCFAPKKQSNFLHGQLSSKLYVWADLHMGEDD